MVILFMYYVFFYQARDGIRDRLRSEQPSALARRADTRPCRDRAPARRAGNHMNGQPRRARHDDSGDAALLDLPALASLVDGHCGNPFALLGPHAAPDGKHTIIRAYLPPAARVEVIARNDDTQLAELSTPQSPGL